MPRISLYRPEKGNDFKFLDKQISEQFQVGGTDVYLHKYLGPKNPDAENATADQPIYDNVKETNIQDLLFLENRDRTYDPDIFRLRGIYNVQDLDFNLSQFALFIDNDVVFMTVHINDFIKLVGRKPMSGDVVELPHLRDEFALNDADISLPRYYKITDVSRASEGFSATWYPHLYRLKLKKITAKQQFADIFNKPIDEEVNFRGEWDSMTAYFPGDVVRYKGQLYNVLTGIQGEVPSVGANFSLYVDRTLEDILTNKNAALEINRAVLNQAEADAPMSGYETRQFYTLAVINSEDPKLSNSDDTLNDASSDDPTKLDAGRIMTDPLRDGYTGYLLGDGIPPNGAAFGHGISFPVNPIDGDFFLRTDFMPNRLFRFNGSRWIKREDSVRHTLSNTDTRSTQKFGFINNTKSDSVDGVTIPERQPVSKALKPKADL